MMKIAYVIIISIFLLISHQTKAQKSEDSLSFNKPLAKELARMKQIDQIAASLPKGKYKEMSREEWKSFKDSVFKTHQKRLYEIIQQHGYPGFDLVGKKGSRNFWLMVQHSDFDPAFQKRVLDLMKEEVEVENASGRHWALLTDRYRLNTGKKQLYGTQVEFDQKTCRSVPKSLADSADVNRRRAEAGLGPLEEYLNRMTKLNFRINKEFCAEQGITEPKLYPVSSQDEENEK